MKRIPETFVEELRRNVDIVDVVSEYVQLRRAGRSHVGLCPFHNERTPSFSVSPERQMFHCFGCGAGGTVLRFVMDIEGLSFFDAVKKLAERANVEFPFDDGSDVSSSRESKFQRMKEAHELAAKLYSYILMNTAAGVQALTYLEKRGILRQTVVDFRIGYAPDQNDSLVSFLKRRGFDTDLILEAGLGVAVGNQVLDRFRGRVMIPIADSQGAVVAFGGRALSKDVKAKYLNSPETPLFHKGQLLFNQHAARRDIRKAETVILFEGYMDVISAWQAGTHNCVASLGTSLTPEQAGLLRRMCDKVIIAYDGDSAGVNAAKRALDICEKADLTALVAQFPDGLDPDEYIQTYGAEAFRRYLRVGPVSGVHFGLQQMRQTANLQNAAGRTEYLRHALELLGSRASPVEQEAELRDLAKEFEVSVPTLKEELALVTKQIGRRKNRSESWRERAPDTVNRPLQNGAVIAGNRILQAMMIDGDSYRYVLERSVDELVQPQQTALLALIYAFRAAHPEAGAAAFLDSLDDPELVRLASSLMMEETPGFDPAVLEDYLRTIELHRVETAYKAALERLLDLRGEGDTGKLEDLKSQIEALQEKIAYLKQPHTSGKAKSGAKEAGKS